MKQLPLFHPIGCPPKPPKWPELKVDTIETGKQMQALRSQFVNGLELEQCGIYDLEEGEQAQHCGSGGKPRFEWRQSCEAIAGVRPATGAD